MTREELLEMLLVERFGVLPVRKPVHNAVQEQPETAEDEGVVTIEQGARRRVLARAVRTMSA